MTALRAEEVDGADDVEDLESFRAAGPDLR